ncbi:hypothetical protein L1887_48781 [Cichorium endivia]|nr:hypothetical protein L1887_48781 [Cichorium endivia]
MDASKSDSSPSCEIIDASKSDSSASTETKSGLVTGNHDQSSFSESFGSQFDRKLFGLIFGGSAADTSEKNDEPPSKKRRDELKRELKRELRAELESEVRGELKRELGAELECELRTELKRELRVELSREIMNVNRTQAQASIKSDLTRHLSIFLYCDNYEKQEWSCWTSFTVILYNRTPAMNFVVNGQHTFKRDARWKKLISCPDVIRPLAGFVQNDKIFFGLEFFAEPLIRATA